MVHAVPDILARIVASKRSAPAPSASERAALERSASSRTGCRDFRAALTNRRPAVIGEIKRASPSKGVFTQDFQPAAIARIYATGGAAALSVLTDSEFFQGSLADLESARGAVSIPALRKDFTISELDVIEAAARGADAILLIAAILDGSEMRRLRELADRYRMAALVEVHDETEIESALDSGAQIIGVNNRNLHTFETSIETSLRLAEKVPSEIVKVSESGIRSRADIARLEDAGFHAFLIGEHLMRSADPAASLRELQS
ncbi:MAG TPA: indole-3-glycerol phosphate synthase TrpC [Bryobacteraceae bacterium]|nr:indole-3-glycerol phosphate synthase TrpC [Bryobacteraceae bacterium]